MPSTKAKAKAWLALAVLAVAAAAAQQAAALPGAERFSCQRTSLSAVLHFYPCWSAVVPLRPSLPSDACCTALRVLGQTCLCVFINAAPQYGFDRESAMQLQYTCLTEFEPCGSEGGEKKP